MSTCLHFTLKGDTMELSAPAQPATQPGPESAGESGKPAPSTVTFAGQEMEIDAFLKSRKHKSKIDGQETELDYDELIRGYGHNQAANKRMHEAAEIRKGAESRERKLFENVMSWKENPRKAFAALEQLGVDVKTHAHDLVMEQMRLELMSDSERKAYENEQRLSEYENRDKLEAQKRKDRELEALREQSATELEDNILKVLESNKDYPVDPAFLNRALDYVSASLNTGENLSLDDAFKAAKRDFDKQSQELFDRRLKTMLEKGEFPKELVDRVRKSDVEALRVQPPKRNSAPEPQKRADSSKSVDDFFNKMDERFKK